MLKEYVEENYYARFYTQRYLRFRETHCTARFDIKLCQSHYSAKSKSTALDRSVCLKSMSKTITIKGLTFTVIISPEKLY